jgi:hypothetical protein
MQCMGLTPLRQCCGDTECIIAATVALARCVESVPVVAIQDDF